MFCYDISKTNEHIILINGPIVHFKKNCQKDVQMKKNIWWFIFLKEKMKYIV